MGKWVPLGGSKNPIAWCAYHRFTLSKNQMKRKKCLEKECPRLVKKTDHPFWVQREKKKAEAKANRKARKERLKNTK